MSLSFQSVFLFFDCMILPNFFFCFAVVFGFFRPSGMMMTFPSEEPGVLFRGCVTSSTSLASAYYKLFDFPSLSR